MRSHRPSTLLDMPYDVRLLPDEPFTTPQALARGCSGRDLMEAVANRELTRLFTGVYLKTSIELSLGVRAQAASLVISPYSVVIDRSAAWMHSVDALDLWELDVIPPLESCVLRGHDPTDRAGVDGHTRDLRPEDWVRIGGVRVTTPVRTAMDLGCLLRPRTALGAMDELMRLHGFGDRDMRMLLPRYRRRRGVVQLRRLVPLVDARAESQPESWTRWELARAGLPTPTPQYWIVADGRPRYRLDLAYPHARVAIEYDGEEFHSDPLARARDEERRGWLRSHGWTVIVLDRRSFGPDAIDAWVGQVRVALRLSV